MLALSLIALGAELVADDQVQIMRKDDGLIMSAAPALQNQIEARGIGILHHPTRPALMHIAVDLDATETQRLPERQEIVIAGVKIRQLRRVESAAFPSMLYVLLSGGAT